MERLKQADYRLKAKQYFFTNRPYGIRIDIRKPGYVLFNKNLNVLGNAQPSQLEHLPIELFESIDDIPMEGEVIEKKDGIIDIYFYSDNTIPYMHEELDLPLLKHYNQYMFGLSLVLNREL